MSTHELQGRWLATESVPTFPADGQGFKVPAAWLIERAGFRKGFDGVRSVSRRPTPWPSSITAVAPAKSFVALARDIREGVRRRFDIELQPEPVFLGFPTANPLSSGLQGSRGAG